jgi:hypothetical protein
VRRSGHNTLLYTTGLVNDAYLRVTGAAALRHAAPGQLMAYAAPTMRSVITDLARERQACPLAPGKLPRFGTSRHDLQQGGPWLYTTGGNTGASGVQPSKPVAPQNQQA